MRSFSDLDYLLNRGKYQRIDLFAIKLWFGGDAMNLHLNKLELMFTKSVLPREENDKEERPVYSVYIYLLETGSLEPARRPTRPTDQDLLFVSSTHSRDLFDGGFAALYHTP